MENIGKIVIAKDRGKNLGYIIDVAFDFNLLKKIGYYVVERETEAEFLLLNEDIENCKNDYVIIYGEEKLQFCDFQREGLVGKPVINDEGILFGNVQKIDLCNNKISKIITDKCEIFAKHIDSIKMDCVFLHSSRRRKQRKKSIVMKHDEIRVKIQSSQTFSAPDKITLSPSFYLGEVAKEDIIGFNHERIVNRGEKITKNVFENVKKHNKLNELFFAIKK